MSNFTRNMQFLSVENLSICIGIFTTYMKEKHNLVFEREEMKELKKMLFSIMKSVEDEQDTKSVHDLNVHVLSKAKDAYVSRLSKHKPNIKNLDRETEVYGNRHVNVNELIPQRDPYMRKAISNMDKFIDEREEMYQKPKPDISKLGKQITEKPENMEDFLKKLKSLEDERTSIDEKLRGEMQSQPTKKENDFSRHAIDTDFRKENGIEKQDPKMLYNFDDKNMFKERRKEITAADDIMTSRQELLIPPPKPNNTSYGANSGINGGTSSGGRGSSGSQSIQKFISINSIDRNWTVDNVRRYNYSVTFNGDGISGNYKNIRSIEVGKVIIPEEISENVNILNIANKTQFNYEFSFSYPYLILRIDEFADVYDGTNDTVRRSFCKLVYHKSYKAPNGRGYVILKPMQKEKKQFYPSPLSSLSRLTISLLKPNGFLLNDSTDSYRIFKIDYDPFNPHYYQVVIDVFFDKNEFYVGDVILVKHFRVVGSTNGVAADKLVEYINRAEGHEILQIGATNNNGFWRSFYIKAIGVFDKKEGKFDTDLDVVACLNEYNDTINYTTFTGSNGHILNTSLQNSMGMSIETLTTNTSMIEPALV